MRFDREAVDSPPFVMDNNFFSTASDGYMVLWTPPLSCVLELLCKMGSSGLLRNCGLLEARKSPRNRFDAGFWPLKTFSNQNRILDGAKPFRNGRMVTKFGIFFAWKSAVLSKADIQSHEDSAHFSFGNRLKNSFIISENFIKPIGVLWNVFEFSGPSFRASYTKSTNGPLVCGALGVQNCPLDLSQRHVSATISTILEGSLFKTHRERKLFPASLCDRVFGGFSPQKLCFLENEDTDQPWR